MKSGSDNKIAFSSFDPYYSGVASDNNDDIIKSSDCLIPICPLQNKITPETVSGSGSISSEFVFDSVPESASGLFSSQHQIFNSQLEEELIANDDPINKSSSIINIDQPFNNSKLNLDCNFFQSNSDLDFKILTFNAGLLEYTLGGYPLYQNPPFTWRRLEHIPVALRVLCCDVVVLQEVYDERQAQFLADTLQLIYPYVGRKGSGTVLALHNGLMILSRFPISRVHFHSFDNVTFLESVLGSKGVLEATIQFPDVGLVTILNSHLASGAVDPESSFVEETRRKETLEILKIASEIFHRGETPIIIGDLNSAPDQCSKSYECLIANGWTDCFLTARANRPKIKPTSQFLAESIMVNGTLISKTETKTGQDNPKSRYQDFCAQLLSEFGVREPESNAVGAQKDYTWDPSNPLNMLGPHSNCRGLRCDHVFIPPPSLTHDSFRNLIPVKADIVFQEPRVLASTRDSVLLFLFKAVTHMLCTPLRTRKSLLVTLSDHNGVVIRFQRNNNRPLADPQDESRGDRDAAPTSSASTTTGD